MEFVRWFLLAVMAGGSLAADGFHLNIIHMNDFHARFEPIAKSGGVCRETEKDTCIGGLARIIGEVRRLKKEDPDALFLNAGDNFQGSMWYNVFRWNATQHFLNMEPADAITLGNHEFDDGVAGVVPFLKHIKSPVLVANLNATEEPEVKAHIKASTIIERRGRKIGIIGALTTSTAMLDDIGKLSLTDVLEAVEVEGARLEKEGANIIVVLSHSGLLEETHIANNSKYADIVVGGHSHSLLFTGSAPEGEIVADSYPRAVTQEKTNRKVLVVQSGSFSKFLGNIHAYFSDEGDLTSWEGNSIYLSSEIKQADDVAAELEKWAVEIRAAANEVVGRTLVDLSMKPNCYYGECVLANFITDAEVDSLAGKGEPGSWTAAAIGVGNAGSFRAPIARGNITYADLLATTPFDKTIDTVEIKGSDLLDALEASVSVGKGYLLHWSGLRVIFDLSKEEGKRVVNATVRCHKCVVPTYGPIEKDTWYPVVGNSYIFDRPGQFPGLEKYRNRKVGPKDIDMLKEHLKKRTAVLKELDGRIVALNSEGLVKRITDFLKGRGEFVPKRISPTRI